MLLHILVLCKAMVPLAFDCECLSYYSNPFSRKAAVHCVALPSPRERMQPVAQTLLVLN